MTTLEQEQVLALQKAGTAATVALFEELEKAVRQATDATALDRIETLSRAIQRLGSVR